MYVIFLLLFVFSFFALIIGLVDPSLVIRWNDSKTKKRVVLYFGFILIISSMMLSVTDPSSKNQEIMVRVVINDYTVNNPVDDKAELWFRGYGSWWLKEELEFGGTVKSLGKKPVSSIEKMYLYPDSRDGYEIEISFMMKSDMNPEGSARDSIHIDIKDDGIDVWGVPIREANGVYEMNFVR